MRQTDGTLRHANPVERDLTLQVYYPADGKMYRMPKMFEDPGLLRVRENVVFHEPSSRERISGKLHLNPGYYNQSRNNHNDLHH